MLKNKSLVIVSILVLVLAVVAMACAPAAPAKPPVPPVTPTPVAPVTPPAPTANATVPAAPVAPVIVEKVTTFKSVKYTDPTYKFSVAYPEGWAIDKATLKGGVFYAVGPDGDVIYVAVRPATKFQDAAGPFMQDLLTAKNIPMIPTQDWSTVTLADGTKADVVELSLPFGAAKAAITGVIKDGNAIMVLGASKTKNIDLYKEIGSTLITK